MVVDTLTDSLTDQVFHALADGTRRDILRRAARGEHSVSALARSYDISLTAVQKHVSVLQRAGLIEKRRRGREQIVCVQPDALRTARTLLDQLEALWRTRVDLMDQILQEPERTT